MCRPLSDGQSGSIQTVLTNAGFNGFGNFSSTFGTAQYIGFPVLDSTVTPVLSEASQPACENDSRMRQSTQELEKPAIFRTGIPLGAVLSRVTLTMDASLKDVFLWLSG